MSRRFSIVAGALLVLVSAGCDTGREEPWTDASKPASPPPAPPEAPTTARSAFTGAAPGALTASVVGVMSVEDPLARAALLASLLRGFGPDAVSEVQEAWTLVVRDGGEPATVELALLVEWWGRHDPEGAFHWLEPRHYLRDPTLVAGLVRAWATRDPIAASTMLAELSQRQKDPSRLTRALVEGWNASGQPGVEEYLIALPPGKNRQIALAGLMRSKVRREGIEKTIRWAEALPDDAAEKFKLRTFRRVASAITEVDPLRAAAWTESQLDSEWGPGLPRRVAARWSLQDGQSAMEWLRGLPASDDLPGAVEEAYRTWMSQDREPARAWLREQKPDAFLDPAIALYALGTARDDPEAALPWAARVQDEQRRHGTLAKIALTWLYDDPDAARAWLETSELSEAARTRVYEAQEKAEMRAKKRAAVVK
jgi:hypothetical protein